MNEEKMREEFEAWVKTKGWNTLRSTVYGFDYQSDITEEYWKSWQAACASKQKEIDSLQAKIDALTLEFCPDEMTDEQVATWELNQRQKTRRMGQSLRGDCKDGGMRINDTYRRLA